MAYVVVAGAGHTVPLYQPELASILLREFILGSNTTGLVPPNSTTPIGGEDPQLAGEILPGNSAIFFGSVTTESTVAPSASFASWASFLATATAAPTPTTIV
jgi:carboxypeptidase D